MTSNIDSILKERGQRYGKFVEHANITCAIKREMHEAILRRADGTFCNDHIEALDMIAHKIGRILNGDPNYADSWDDIAGYAKLVADRIRGDSK